MTFTRTLWRQGKRRVCRSARIFIAQEYAHDALYTGSGTYNMSASVPTLSFAPDCCLSVYSDLNANTIFTKPANGSNAWNMGTTSVDYLIATGSSTSGQAALKPNLSTSSSSTRFNLTSAGRFCFTSSNPFYNYSVRSDQLNYFTPTGPNEIIGSMDMVFSMLEQTSVALVGLGMQGLRLSPRKKQPLCT